VNNKEWFQNWSWVGYLNFFLLQWFFVRLARVHEVHQNTKNIYMLKDQGWKFLRWIVPLTGWWNDYKYIGE
jgi:hypothetical protein